MYISIYIYIHIYIYIYIYPRPTHRTAPGDERPEASMITPNLALTPGEKKHYVSSDVFSLKDCRQISISFYWKNMTLRP